MKGLKDVATSQGIPRIGALTKSGERHGASEKPALLTPMFHKSNFLSDG